MHDFNRVAEVARLEVVFEHRAGPFQHCGQSAANLSQSDYQSFTFFLH